MMKVAMLAVAALMGQASAQTKLFTYTSLDDVSDPARIDLDIEAMKAVTSPGSADYTTATDIYENGQNSAAYTLKQFSTLLEEKAAGLQTEEFADREFLAEYNLFKAYYGDDSTYADTFVAGALAGTSISDQDARQQFVLKGIQYQSVFMFVLRELYEAVKSCESAVAYDGRRRLSGATKAWDEGVAFYTGSLIDENGNGAGQLQFTLAQKRCSTFGQCSSGEPIAETNTLIFKAFTDGRDALEDGECEEAYEFLLIARKYMQIPLIQGMLQYTLKSDPAVDTATTKSKSEAWAFARGVLPYFRAVDEENAEVVRSILELTDATEATYLNEGYKKVFDAMYFILPKLCISCEEIGIAGLMTTAATEWSGATIPTCTTDETLLDDCDFLKPPTSAFSTAAIIALVASAVVFLAVLSGGIVYMKRQNAEASSEKKDLTTSSV